MTVVSSYTSWQPLEEVIVGRAYPADYFDFIENAQVRNQLQQILDETQEDLDCLEQQLKNCKITTFRPTNTTDNVDILNLPKSPLSPRDHLLMLGNNLAGPYA